MRVLLGALLVVVLAAGVRAEAQAPAAIVVVIGPDPAFTEALADALVDNQIVAGDEQPTPALDTLAASSRRVAEERGAVATVWLTRAQGGAALVTYERTSDRFLVRELPYAPPLSPTQAAEAARMVRTMLRALRTPDEDATGSTVTSENQSAPPRPRPSPPPLAALLGLGAWFAAPGAAILPSVAPGIAWRPFQWGAALSAALAPSATIDTLMFRGEVRDIVVAGELRYSLALSPQIRLTPVAGVAFHVVGVRGTLASGQPGGQPIDYGRVNPAVRVGAFATVPVARALEVGLGLSADTLLTRQTYEADGEQLLVVPRVQVMLGAIVLVIP